MGKILNDPHTFFENLSDEGFFELLNDMEICYTDVIKESNNILKDKKDK